MNKTNNNKKLYFLPTCFSLSRVPHKLCKSASTRSKSLDTTIGINETNRTEVCSFFMDKQAKTFGLNHQVFLKTNLSDVDFGRAFATNPRINMYFKIDF